ncbi:hypothetical protein GCK32_021814, partial [Trichostrongylus colubriformis]
QVNLRRENVTLARYSSDHTPAQKIHTIRLRWSPAKNAETYRVHCEANGTNEVLTILDRQNLTSTTSIDERFLFPSGQLFVICGVRASNAHGSSGWTYSPVVTIHSLTIETTSISPGDYAEEITQVSTDDINLDQLLKLIHASKIEDLSVQPITRAPEERVIVRPPGGQKPSSSEYAEKPGFSPVQEGEVEFLEKDIEEDYEILEEDIRRAIGASKKRKPEKFGEERFHSSVDRVL